MSNYRFIMEGEENVKSDVDGRLVLEPTDSFAKVEYEDGKESYAKGFTDYHKGSENEDRRMSEADDYNG